MHLRFLASGWDRDLDFFEKWISSRFAPIKIKNKKGKEEIKYVPIALRPIRAYDLVFPKEFLDVVLNTLKPENCQVSRVDGKGTQQFKTLFTFMRKLLKLKKIPASDKTKGEMARMVGTLDNIRIVGLGIQEDGILKYDDGTEHEGL